jgi:cyclopropane fatty-acyl-phospholipid synthase-like methyltransferase
MYKKLALYYDGLFPLQTEFAEKFLHTWKRGTLLDVGCGTGLFLEFLQRNGWTVQGLEYTEDMALLAREKGLKVTRGGFSQISQWKDLFDHITCLGNTLPHAFSLDELKVFFEGSFEALKPIGTLHVQIILFDSLL